MEIEEQTIDEIAENFILTTPKKEEEGEKDDSQVETEALAEQQTPDDASENADQPEETEEESSEDDEGSDDDDIDIDEVEVDVVVDGETKQVKLKDLKANYSGEGAIERRLQEATEVRQKVYEVGTNLYRNLEAQAERLRRLDEVLATAVEEPIDWEGLRQREPGRYLLEKERVREIEEKRSRIYQENQRIYREQQELNEMAMRDITIQQARLLVEKIPELAKPETAKPTMDSFIETARYYGFSPQDVNGIIDHRMMLVLADAAKYRKSMAAKNPKDPSNQLKETKPRKLVRPSSTASKKNSVTSAFKKMQEANLKRARATGAVDDVAKLLMVRKKSG